MEVSGKSPSCKPTGRPGKQMRSDDFDLMCPTVNNWHFFKDHSHQFDQYRLTLCLAGFSVMNGSETGRGAGTTESSCTLKHSP